MELQRESATPLLLSASTILLQERRPSPTPHSHPGARAVKASRRQQIVKEIFESEHSYITQLNTIVNLFLKPTRVNGLLPSDVAVDIFSNIEGILSVNTELFSCMRRHSLAEAFSYLGPFLKLYSTYASNYQNALETLQTWLKQNQEFSMFVSTQENRPECNNLNLPALLLVPVQRIPRYKLLLEELLKHTRCTHLDYSKLNAAIQQIAAVASHINEFIRQQDNFKKMLAIQNSLAGSYIPGIVAPGRRFVKEGKLMKVCRRRPKQRMVFLFSDMLLYARPHLLDIKANVARSYESRGVIPLLTSEVQMMFSNPRAPGVDALFEVFNEENSLTFFSYSEEEVFEWAQVIENTIRALQVAYASMLVPQLRRMEANQHMGVQGYSSQRESLLEASYPLTPDTPLSNLASGSNPFSVFYERVEEQQQEEKEEEEEEEERSTRIAAQQEHEGEMRRNSGSVEQDDHTQTEDGLGGGGQPLLPVDANRSAIGHPLATTAHSKCCIIL